MNQKKKNMLYPDSKNGIYLYEYPMINGIRQYVQVRGSDRRNPLLLFLHGGPGSSLAGLCHVLQAGWEENFTVVNWDQRNTCKTYFANKSNAKTIAQTGTMEDYVQDIDEIIAYLHTVYDFEKLILMGFSWGSAIGAEYAKRHPEHLLCYVGVGQHINYTNGLQTICNTMLKIAEQNQNTQDIVKIQTFIDSIPQEAKMTKAFKGQLQGYIGLASKYFAKSSKAYPMKALLTSPFLNCREKLSMISSDFTLLEKPLTTMMTYEFRRRMCFSTPVLFIFGEEDFSCPASLLADCFDDVSAPSKKLEIIPNASHTCFYDQPTVFLSALSAFFDSLCSL